MSKNRTTNLSRMALVTVTALFAATASAAPPNPKVAVGTVYIKYGFGLTNPDGTLTQIVLADLPSGRYAISANAQVDNAQSSSDVVTCRLFNGNPNPNPSYNPDEISLTVPADGFGALTLLATFEVESAHSLVTVDCDGTNIGAHVRIDSTLVAELVPAIINLP